MEPLINSDRNFCEIEFVRFLIEKLAIVVIIGHFYSEKLADSSLRKTNHELIRASLWVFKARILRFFLLFAKRIIFDALQFR